MSSGWGGGGGGDGHYRNMQRVRFVDGARQLLVRARLGRRGVCRLVVVSKRMVVVVVVASGAAHWGTVLTRFRLLLQVQFDLVGSTHFAQQHNENGEGPREEGGTNKNNNKENYKVVRNPS